MTKTAHISLGSNLGDRRSTILSALDSVDRCEGVRVLRCSSLREYPAIGGPPNQPTFLNGAATIETSLPPAELMHCLMESERERGRSRLVRWQARTLDIDLVLFGAETIDEPGLEVPHPRFALRPFVLTPLDEIAPDAVDPLTRRTVHQLLEGLRTVPPRLVVLGPDLDTPAPLARLVDLLEPEGWIVTDRVDASNLPTLVAILPSHDRVQGQQGPGGTLGRWESARRMAFPSSPPERPTCPFYWPEPVQVEDAIHELLAICRGITNT